MTIYIQKFPKPESIYLQFFEQIMTATVETVSEQLDLTTIIPMEKIDTTLSGSALTSKDNGLSILVDLFIN